MSGDDNSRAATPPPDAKLPPGAATSKAWYTTVDLLPGLRAGLIGIVSPVRADNLVHVMRPADIR
jgi:hypothetical protein